MWEKRRSLALVVISLLLMVTGSGCLRLLQPVSEVHREFNFVDYDAPALRLARPVKAELLSKNSSGEWVPIGRGIIPAGAYIKGRAPSSEIAPAISSEGDK